MDNIVDILQSRGMVDATTGDEMKEATRKPTKVYCGFDPTSDSLHVGNMVALMTLAWFQRCGHTPVAIVGGATGMVGDPSGKSAERNLLDNEAIERNLQGIRSNLEAFLDFDHPTAKPIILNNYDWFGQFTLIDFLRDVGKYFRVGTMLAKESVRGRLNSDEGMSFTEFSYQLLQGYDFLHLYREYDVKVQIGGSDQWGNIIGGTELIRKATGGDAYGLTMPLLTRSDGKKFGKSESGAIWLSGDKLSPFEFYQHLYRMPDADVIKLLKVLTFLELDEIDAIEAAMKADGYAPNTAQKRLAEEVTRIVHGDEGVAVAERATASVRPGSHAVLDAETLEASAGDIPTMDCGRDQVLQKKIVDLLMDLQVQSSRGEARRLIRNGGCYVNNQKVEDEHRVVLEGDLLDDRLLLLGIGKKKKVLVKVK